MRVLQLISSGGYYGAENMVVNLADALNNRGYSNVIGVFHNLHNPHTEIAERAQNKNLCVEVFPCKGRLDWKVIGKLRRCMRDHSFDIVHTHGYKANLHAWLASRGLAIPLVATCHNWTRGTTSLRLYAQLDVFVLRGFDRIVGVSTEVVDTLKGSGVRTERLLMIRNGVNISATPEIPPSDLTHNDGKKIIGVVGRLVPEKGFQYLLESAPAILSRFPGTEFLFVGGGPFRGQLEKLSRDLRIERSVVFAGEQRDMQHCYESMDILALPSLREGLPMSILEAMAAGKPVVATSVGAIPGLVIPEQTGLLVKPKDQSGLANALCRLLADSELRSSLGANARMHIRQNYSSEAMARSYSTLYQTLTRGNECDSAASIRNQDKGSAAR